MQFNKSNAPLKSGLLLINKPRDFSSHDIIAICRRELKTKKIGHSGTLDPMATGLLLLLIGRDATKLQDTFLKKEKVYSATLSLGVETESWDAYSDVINEQLVPTISQEQLLQAIQPLSGQIQQPIPFFSAKHINGNRMYELARKGIEMERQYNTVNICWQNIKLVDSKTVFFTIKCSSGTYVRSIGYMLAKQLGTIGHLTELCREQIDTYKLDDAFDGNKLKGIGFELYNHVRTI